MKRPESPALASSDSYASTVALRLAHPLDRFYARLKQPLPPLAEVEPNQVPEPQRTLLVHERDMTPTLEAHFGEILRLQVLKSYAAGQEYFREVLLALADSGNPVEFGAIKINLDLFPAPARQHILEEREPLGHILQTDRIPHLCRPRAFLRVASDVIIDHALQLTGAHVLYGRANSLLNPAGLSLAEVVEILPPLNPTMPRRISR